MKKIGTLIFVFSILAGSAAAKIDPRQYVDWNRYPYNIFVLLNSNCTAQYVGRNLLLTAMHCVAADGYYRNENSFVRSDGAKCTAELAKENDFEKYSFDTVEQTADWALLKVSDDNAAGCFAENILQVMPEPAAATVDNIGFGYMRIVTDAELAILRKKLYNLLIQDGRASASSAGDMQYKGTFAARASGILNDYMKSIEMTDAGGGAMESPFKDGGRLKMHAACQITRINDNGGFYNNCVAYGGNSGGAFVNSGTTDLVGTVVSVNSQELAFGENTKGKSLNFGVGSKVFYQKILDLLNQ